MEYLDKHTGKQESRNFNLTLLSVFKLFFTFRFFLLLYLLVRTCTTFIRAPSCQNFHYFSISFDNPLTTLCCLSFTGPYYRSSYTCSQPATGYTALLLTALWVQPCPPQPHHSSLSTHLSSLPVRTSAHCLARSQPYLTSTQSYIHLNKLLSAYITSTARSRNSSTHLS